MFKMNLECRRILFIIHDCDSLTSLNMPAAHEEIIENLKPNTALLNYKF